MYIGNNEYTTIKEAIQYSTEPYGLIAIYVSKEGKKFYFLNGLPVKKNK